MITWPFDPTVYAGLLILYFGHAVLARSASDAERKHTLFFFFGLFFLWLALESPIDTIGDRYLDSVHMLQHVLLAFVAPPLMLLGLSREMVRKLLGVPGLRALAEPVPAQVIAASIMVGWHVPALYDATLRDEGLHVLEHVMFVASGLILYWPVLQTTSAEARWTMSAGARLVFILLATLPQDGVALVLIFSRVPFYEFYAHAPRLVAGYTALIDQTIAGAALMVFGKITLGIAAGVVFFRWFGAEHREDQGIESAVRVR